ncbi:MAG TPA: FimV/HubP family polar landmark protein [Usitatibacter sp.]|jgi:pilus assembly protein FimV|nr:FimV/HubP family polar landmark protein [Usitatibacter sp.]
MVSKLKSGAALALLVSASISAHAVGLGKLTINSALGQTLNAEIDLVQMQQGEDDNLSARVASPDAFRDARIEYSNVLRMLRFSVEKHQNGQSYLKVTSIGPINEPFVDVLIEMTWPAGRIQREYPILLDPPGYAQGKVAPPVTTAAATPAAPAAAPAPAPAETTASAAAPAAEAPSAPTPPVAASSEPTPAPAPEAKTEAASGTPSAQAELKSSTPAATASDTYGPIESGETLSKIAAQVKPAEVSLEQMLVALYRQNEGAFSGKNMNRLKTGQILKVPSAEEISAIEQKDAQREIHTQVADWKSYRDQLASGAAALPAKTADNSNAASGSVTSAAVTPPAPATTPSQDSLKLSKADAGGKAGAGKGGGAGQERVNALQEELIAKDKALRESQSRVSDLEKQIQDMQRLIQLTAGATPATKGDAKGTSPSSASKSPEASPPPPAPAEAPKVATAEPPKTATTEPAKAPDATTPSTAASATSTPTATPLEAPKTEASTTAQPPKTDDGKAAPKVARKVVPPPRSFMDELLDNPAYLAAGGGLALALIGGFIFMRRRRSRDEMDPNSQMTSAFPSDLKPGGNTSKPAGGLVDTGNSSFLTDFDKTGPGTIDTDEVDPVAEAEVYMAYGRDAQAEEILKEAMARDRGRHEIALKLLEIYHARKSATAFENVAKELRAAVGESHPLWQKAAAMGAQIDPSNPLYVAAASGTATYQPLTDTSAHPKPNLDFDLDSSSSSATSSAPAFDLDLDAQKPSSASAPAASSSGLDFDLAPGEGAKMDMPAEQPAKEDKPSFDFDLSGLDFPGSKASSSPAAAAPASSGGSLDLADLSLDSPSGEGGEGVGTKLELAKAYLEIGDKDGAREILQEVAKEGSSDQREEAKKLIASL